MTDLKAAKELLHIQGWLERVDDIVERGKDAYLTDDLLQEAGDSLMMKPGEAANRLSKLGVLAPEDVEWALAIANRNVIIHQYDEINVRSRGRRSLSTCLSGNLARAAVSGRRCRDRGRFRRRRRLTLPDGRVESGRVY